MKALTEKEWIELQKYCEEESRINKGGAGIYIAIITIKKEVDEESEKFTW